MKISIDYNDKEFFEFIWLFERLQTQRTKEAEAQKQSGGSGSSLTGGMSRGGR